MICHTDGAWNEEKLIAGLGWTLQKRNTNEQSPSLVEQGAQIERFVTSPLMPEAIALRQALFNARDRGTSKLSVFADSQILVGAINGHNQIKEAFGIIQDIIRTIPNFSFIEFHYVPRSKNTMADSLAKAALRSLSSVTEESLLN